MVGCTPNIGVRQRRRRLVFGAAGFVIAVVLGVALARAHASVAVRALVFVPLYAGALGWFQHRAQTCVAFAARGVRDIGAGMEVVTDAAELEAARVQARRVQRNAILGAGLLTVLYILVS